MFRRKKRSLMVSKHLGSEGRIGRLVGKVLWVEYC